MIRLLFLSYRALGYMNQWFHPEAFPESNEYYIVDNGQQSVPDKLSPYILWQTEKNTGFSGGVNILAHIAFDKLGFEKIIVGQDDAQFTQDMLENIWLKTDSNTLVGAYNRSFEFALFGLHHELFRTVGDFDENFIFGGCEDNDYKHRIKLAGKQVVGLNYDASMNCSYSSMVEGDKLKLPGVYNATYIKMKWGSAYEYSHPFNDNSLSPFGEMPMQSGITDVYGDISEYPSKTELKRYDNRSK